MPLIPKAIAQTYINYEKYNEAIGLNDKLTNNSLSGIVGYFLPYLLTIAGLILFGMLIFGGFTMLTGAASKESQERGKKMITGSLTGFAIIFFAYWIAQILQVIFKVGIVSQ